MTTLFSHPEAQEPLICPLREEHSLDEKHVPLRNVV
jgi:hypothetical protein